ncbi:hypothetical protein EIN_274970 [Entamoeba invadens IP1]|uniref:protein-histidine N-methyltransferase n=1 Tax=Entamoeba invadens IP1 TaxID=370355 RepID=A0A0A1U1L1_ENTIV|nr:hypothetical protein EIN_274970 [Entamoeba invadens IP1]ELP87910.1 hypothetical protein EIN_274970 [Entamoeba invadens IP1]|eukprot:XP_004254681.1 hypothetical protein EIN_274970 [Entamoeba invadens IP1]
MDTELYPSNPPQVKKIKQSVVQTIQAGVYEGGFQIWEGGDDLYNHIATTLPKFSNKRVMELGCGQALPSILLKLNGATVDVSDYNKEVIDLTKLNFQANGLSLETTKFYTGDWDLLPTSDYDFVIGADVTYNPENHTKLAHAINRLLSPHGEAIIATKVIYPGNNGLISDFNAVMTSLGFTYSYTQVNSSGVVRLIVTYKRHN